MPSAVRPHLAAVPLSCRRDRRMPRPWRARIVVTILALLVSASAASAMASPASAASQGSGFGTWAPLSAHGWHGSMLVNGVHTYCILPGLPAPTGESTDHGVRADAGGLSPQQLVGINRIVTSYGQTDDAVQAAAVGWAVKAVADRQTTLHAWGYPGDSLAEAVHWTFDRLAPEHAAGVAALAEQYYAEAIAATVPGTAGTLTLAPDPAAPDDPRRATIRLGGAEGTTTTVTLTHAVFADSGIPTRSDVAVGEPLAILTTPPAGDGAPYRVQASARIVAAFAPAVRFFTATGQQNTAGPGGGVDVTIEAVDAAPRPVVFAPTITTSASASDVDAGRYVDEVTITPADGVWPTSEDGAFVSIRATAVVYRTDETPAVASEAPAGAVEVGRLAVATDPALGGGTYRVVSDWALPGPGHYTAVWRIAAADQALDAAMHLERGFAWTEQFGEPTQIVYVPSPPAPTSNSSGVPQELAATGLRQDATPLLAASAVVLILGVALTTASIRRRRTGERFAAEL